MLKELLKTNLFEVLLNSDARLFEELFKNSRLPALIYDSETLEIFAANDYACNTYGYSPDEFREIKFDKIHSSTAVNNEQIDQSFKTSTEKHATKNGNQIEVKVNTYSLESNKRFLKIVLVEEIIHAQMSEIDETKLLNVLLENIPDTIYFKDKNSCFIKVNQAQAKTLGIADALEAIGKSDFDFFNVEHAQSAFEDEQQIIEFQTPVIDKIERIRKSDGKYCWMSATKVPMFDERGEVIGVAGISRDITDRKQAEEQLALLAEKLEQSNRELENFASIASHDLQEPLRKIRAFGDRLKNKYSTVLTEEGVDYLTRLINSTERMQVLINDLLNFSRVSIKEQKFTSLNLNDIVADVVSDLEIRINKGSGKVELAPLPTIEADGSLMRQLFQNLIENALKFHRENIPPVVKISSRMVGKSETQTVSDVNFCEIRIEDNGIGFDEKYLEKIFTIFQRLHGREMYDGTGIGLATCRKIVERHGGAINATSIPGVGSTFIIKLPLKYRAVQSGFED